jgi:hypothetical protein
VIVFVHEIGPFMFYGIIMLVIENYYITQFRFCRGHFILLCVRETGGTWWRSWLRHCATNRKVVGSIPDGVIGSFHWHDPFGCTMALGLTWPVTEMSTRNISWGVNMAGA